MVKQPMRPLEIGVLAGFDQSESAAQLLAAGCAKIGIDIKLNTEPWPVISGKFSDMERSHDIVPLWRSAYFADPHNWTGLIYNSRNIGAGNGSFYKQTKNSDACDRQGAGIDWRSRRAARYTKKRHGFWSKMRLACSSTIQNGSVRSPKMCRTFASAQLATLQDIPLDEHDLIIQRNDRRPERRRILFARAALPRRRGLWHWGNGYESRSRLVFVPGWAARLPARNRC